MKLGSDQLRKFQDGTILEESVDVEKNKRKN
jgi:hypothetical protein